jgi:hypothetical protein
MHGRANREATKVRVPRRHPLERFQTLPEERGADTNPHADGTDAAPYLPVGHDGTELLGDYRALIGRLPG